MTRTTRKFLIAATAVAVVGGGLFAADAAVAGMGGGCPGQQQSLRDRDLTVDEVRTIWAGKLLSRGTDDLKLGDVTESEAGYHVTILDADGKEVRAFDVDKRTGFPAGMRAGWHGHHGSQNGGYHGHHGWGGKGQPSAPANPDAPQGGIKEQSL